MVPFVHIDSYTTTFKPRSQKYRKCLYRLGSNLGDTAKLIIATNLCQARKKIATKIIMNEINILDDCIGSAK